ncbi:phage major capsid protein [Streptomyces hygroscopicus subsp. hygroscopicus]|uniref:phage major capsid protein n=1 Tax=Streptomyces hygroscopicus TaxID=1912 RepID=UPI001C65FCE1|nr:phage major capsid protein [Streptomyces hygroscopicus]MBW8087760.1 phage major capsid protein [Streptomyces hygroscopicus subsp. hygroscopicus]
MSDIVKRLMETRLRAWNEAKELADRAADEKRAFTGEEDHKWEALNTEINTCDERIKEVLEQEKRAEEASALLNRGDRREGSPNPGAQPTVSDELRAWARGERGRYFDVHPSGPVDVRALSKLTAPAGGSVVPQGFYNKLMAHLIENSAILRAGVTVLNTASGETIPVPKTTAHSTASLTPEAGTIGTSEPQFGSVNLGAYKYGTKIQTSTELLTDTGVDLEGYLSMQAGRALGNAFGVHAIVGTGSSQPRGVVTDATLGVTGATGITGGFGSQTTAGQGADYVISLFHSVIAPYRQSASCNWMMSDGTAATIRKLRDSTGQYIWQPALVAGDPDLLLSKPVVIDPNVPTVGLGAKSLIFGDFAQYFVRLAGGIRFERSDDFAFDQDLITFRALMRADGSLVDLTGAIKYFQGGAT